MKWGVGVWGLMVERERDKEGEKRGKEIVSETSLAMGDHVIDKLITANLLRK
jgi:hypothetical protein